MDLGLGCFDDALIFVGFIVYTSYTRFRNVTGVILIDSHGISILHTPCFDLYYKLLYEVWPCMCRSHNHDMFLGLPLIF